MSTITMYLSFQSILWNECEVVRVGLGGLGLDDVFLNFFGLEADFYFLCYR